MKNLKKALAAAMALVTITVSSTAVSYTAPEIAVTNAAVLTINNDDWLMLLEATLRQRRQRSRADRRKLVWNELH